MNRGSGSQTAGRPLTSTAKRASAQKTFQPPFYQPNWPSAVVSEQRGETLLRASGLFFKKKLSSSVELLILSENRDFSKIVELLFLSLIHRSYLDATHIQYLPSSRNAFWVLLCFFSPLQLATVIWFLHSPRLCFPPLLAAHDATISALIIICDLQANWRYPSASPQCVLRSLPNVFPKPFHQDGVSPHHMFHPLWCG